MKRGWIGLAVAIGWAITCGSDAARGAATPTLAASSFKGVLSEELLQIERDIANLIMKRADQSGDRRARIDLQIDLRIIRRALTALVADAKPESPEQATAWLRLKQFTAASRGVEEVTGEVNWAPTGTQKDSMAYLRKLSYGLADIKSGKDLEELSRQLAGALLNIANATPVDSKNLPAMRPKSIATVVTPDGPKDRPATIPELAQQIQQLASISVPLRQQLMQLAQNAAAEKEGQTLYAMLAQSVNLAKGLQANTAVSAENRAAIETQLAEGIALYSDPRTRDAGKSRIDSLGTYRQVLTRIGKMGLTREQVQQMSQGLAWASAAGEPGLKFLTALEAYTEMCGRWDALSREVAMPALKKALDDLATQFARHRTAFVQTAARPAPPVEELSAHVDEMKRLFDIADDIVAMPASIETLNAYKPKPTGALERKITASANASVATARTPARNDAEKFLDSVHTLADRAKKMSTRTLSDVPAAVVQNWAGGKTDAMEARCKGLIAEMATGLVGPSVELDKSKLARLETAAALGDSLRLAGQLDAAVAKSAALSRWADWSIEPQLLGALVNANREAMAGAFAGFATDNLDAVDRWNKVSPRFVALATLVVRDAAYADQCQAMPIGLGGDLARLSTKLEGEPFGTERFASYAIGMWAMYDRLGDPESAERILGALTKRVARDLHLPVGGEDRPRRGKN